MEKRIIEDVTYNVQMAVSGLNPFTAMVSLENNQ